MGLIYFQAPLDCTFPGRDSAPLIPPVLLTLKANPLKGSVHLGSIPSRSDTQADRFRIVVAYVVKTLALVTGIKHHYKNG